MKNASRWMALFFAIVIMIGVMACSPETNEEALETEDQKGMSDVTEVEGEESEEQNNQEELPYDFQHVIEIELIFSGESPENVYALDMKSLGATVISMTVDFTIDEQGRLIAYFGRGFMRDNVKDYGTRFEYTVYPRTEEGFLDLDHPITEPVELEFDNEGNCVDGDYFTVFLD